MSPVLVQIVREYCHTLYRCDHEGLQQMKVRDSGRVLTDVIQVTGQYRSCVIITPCIRVPDCMTRYFRNSQVGIQVVAYRTIFQQMHDVRLGFDIQWIRLLMVDLQRYTLCLKESLQLATTRGHFVCRVHCLALDDYCKIEPVRSRPRKYRTKSFS